MIANLQRQLDLHELKLHSLLSISTAINNNAPMEELTKAYAFVIKEQLNFRKHALLLDYNGWKVFLKSGYKGKSNLEENIPSLLRFKELTYISAPRLMWLCKSVS